MYAVISFSDDPNNESYTTSLFCDFKDAQIFYENLRESDNPCMFFSLSCFDNLYI